MKEMRRKKKGFDEAKVQRVSVSIQVHGPAGDEINQ